MTVRIVNADCREAIRTLADRSVHTVVTSPPYFGLRDYGAADQMGLEATPQAFVDELVALFREIHRILRDDGTVWLNLGDSYAGSGRGGYENGKGSSLQGSTGNQDNARDAHARQMTQSQRRDNAPAPRSDFKIPGLRAKNLIGIPWRVAFALQDDGWFLRQDIIWAKPNPMPESVVDRCTKAHEYLFLLTKSEAYFFDQDAITEPISAAASG